MDQREASCVGIFEVCFSFIFKEFRGAGFSHRWASLTDKLAGEKRLSIIGISNLAQLNEKNR